MISYIITLIALSLLALGIPAIIIYLFVIQPMKKRIAENSLKELKTKQKIIEYIFVTPVLFAVMAISYICFVWVVPYWKDLPQFITSKYSSTTGILTDKQYADNFKTKDFRPDDRVQIKVGGNTYNLDTSKTPAIGTLVNVQYLENTKIVCNLTVKK